MLMEDLSTPSETNALAVDPQSPSPPHAPRRRPRRLERIRDYQEESLGRADALSACLGASNADLMRISYRLSKAVDATLASSAPALEPSSNVYPAMDMLSRLNRQVEHFAELEVRMREASARPQQAPAQRGPRARSREEIKT